MFTALAFEVKCKVVDAHDCRRTNFKFTHSNVYSRNASPLRAVIVIINYR